MTKALFFDIDGTLCSFTTHDIPASAIRALMDVKAAGHRVFIATGRPRILINNLGALEERDLIDGYITMNGGYCFVGEEVIHKSPIPSEAVQAVVLSCAALHTPCILVGEHDIKVCQPDERVRRIFHEYLKVTTPISEVTVEEAVHSGQAIYQLTPFLSKEEESHLAQVSASCEVGRWHPEFADITAKGNTKQRGIDEIIRYFGLSLEETMAFGDGGNDIPMLCHAAIGVAMGNANEEVKAVADYVTTSVDEDGIAHALKHFALI